MPRIYSRRKGADPIPDGAVYVGRGTPWGNRCKMTRESERDRACDWFDGYATAMVRWTDKWLEPLRGKDLVCWCQSPSDPVKKRCHAETLLRLANMPRRGGAEP